MIVRRLIPVFAVLLAAAPQLAAQDPTFKFSTSTADEVAPAVLSGSPNIDALRPNTARELNLFVHNSFGENYDHKIELLDTKGKLLAVAEIKKAKQKMYSRVKFAKPAPPPPMPGAAPPAPPPMPMGPPPPPVPPGTELGRIGGGDSGNIGFTLRLLVPEKGIDTKTDVVVTVLKPETYVKLVGQMQYKNTKEESLLEVTVKAEPNFVEGTSCPVELVFPPQPNLDVTQMGAGVYRKVIKKAGETAKLYATGLPLRVTNDKVNETVYLNIDGVPRAYTFRPNLRVDRPEATAVTEPVDPAVRLIEDGKKDPPLAFVSLPKDRFPIRVEVDNSTSKVQVELSQLKGEVVTDVTLPTPRHEQVWLDPAGEAGGVRVESRVSDWVLPLDTRDMRGQFNLTATLPDAKITVEGEDRIPSFRRVIILDDTPPPVDRIRVEGFPDKQFRGRPMKLKIFAADPESPIVRVGMFLGVPAPDGKLPDPPALALAVPPEARGAPWVVEVQVPADKKGGKESVTVAATNAVGLTTAKTITIQLLDPPTGGTIKGTVIMGEFGKPQAGATVVLSGDDGKVKDSTKTGPKGEYTFTDVPPGAYKVGAAKADSAFGVKGETAVAVKPGGEHTADITMTRKP